MMHIYFILFHVPSSHPFLHKKSNKFNLLFLLYTVSSLFKLSINISFNLFLLVPFDDYSSFLSESKGENSKTTESSKVNFSSFLGSSRSLNPSASLEFITYKPLVSDRENEYYYYDDGCNYFFENHEGSERLVPSTPSE